MVISDKIWDFVQEHRNSDVVKLLLGRQTLFGDELKVAVRQIEGYQYALRKLPKWSKVERLVYPIHISLEQCSSELTAQYKASIIPEGKHLIDLTGGFGVDCFFLSQKFESSTYVEQNTVLFEVVANNYKLLEMVQTTCVNADSASFLKDTTPVDCIFIDPARRGKGGGKLVSIADCEPNVIDLMPLLKEKTRYLFVKLSPMLDISKALSELTHVTDIHIVSVDNECKELLLLFDFKTKEVFEPIVHCVNLRNGESQVGLSFYMSEERSVNALQALELGNYLYEPNASVLKGGAFNLVAVKTETKKLHVNSHLYTSEELVADFPGRSFRVVNTYQFDKKSIKKLKTAVQKANIAIRNFPSTVDTLRKKLQLQDGGDNYLFATTLSDGQKILIHCHKIS